jgi:hypothetical protein
VVTIFSVTPGADDRLGSPASCRSRTTIRRNRTLSLMSFIEMMASSIGQGMSESYSHWAINKKAGAWTDDFQCERPTRNAEIPCSRPEATELTPVVLRKPGSRINPEVSRCDRIAAKWFASTAIVECNKTNPLTPLGVRGFIERFSTVGRSLRMSHVR